MREFLDLYTWYSCEEFEVLCAMVVDSEKEAGRKAQLLDIGAPAERITIL